MNKILVLVASLVLTQQSFAARDGIFFGFQGIMNCSVSESTAWKPGHHNINGFWQREIVIPASGIIHIDEQIQMKDRFGKAVTVPLRIHIIRKEIPTQTQTGIISEIVFSYSVEFYNFLTGKIETPPIQVGITYGEFGVNSPVPAESGAVNNTILCLPQSHFNSELQ